MLLHQTKFCTLLILEWLSEIIFIAKFGVVFTDQCAEKAEMLLMSFVYILVLLPTAHVSVRSRPVQLPNIRRNASERHLMCQPTCSLLT